MTTIDVKRKNIRSNLIIDKPSCENCVYAFKGKIKRNNTGWKGEN
jgi:predicted Zn-ribbon and HTH transcriptional regulator